MIAITDSSGVEQDDLSPDGWEIVFNLEILERVVLRKDLLPVSSATWGYSTGRFPERRVSDGLFPLETRGMSHRKPDLPI